LGAIPIGSTRSWSSDRARRPDVSTTGARRASTRCGHSRAAQRLVHRGPRQRLR
jgi:hypothetical protein